MARRRVFHVRVECRGLSIDLGVTANKDALIGRTVTLQKVPATSEVGILLDGATTGRLDSTLGAQVITAIDRGQSFKAIIVNAYPIYDGKFRQTSSHLDLKVEYMLEKGQPAIEVPTSWRAVESAASPLSSPRSFFTTVAGVSHEGRQRIVDRCLVGEHLILVRDPTNRYDEGAIKVMRTTGEQLGFIPAHVSRGGDSTGLAFRMDRGEIYSCRIKNITGGDDKYLGVNIEVSQVEATEDSSSAEQPVSFSQPTGDASFGWFIVIAFVIAAVIVSLIVWRS